MILSQKIRFGTEADALQRFALAAQAAIVHKQHERGDFAYSHAFSAVANAQLINALNDPDTDRFMQNTAVHVTQPVKLMTSVGGAAKPVITTLKEMFQEPLAKEALKSLMEKVRYFVLDEPEWLFVDKQALPSKQTLDAFEKALLAP